MTTMTRGKSRKDKESEPALKAQWLESLNVINNCNNSMPLFENCKLARQFLLVLQIIYEFKDKLIQKYSYLLTVDLLFIIFIGVSGWREKSINEDKEKKLLDIAWQRIFANDYNKTGTFELHTFISNFIQRLHMLRKYQPRSLIYLLKGVLLHPNLQKLDKNVRMFAYKMAPFYYLCILGLLITISIHKLISKVALILSVNSFPVNFFIC